MPKELAHWTLAAKVSGKLKKTSLFFKPVQQFPNLFLYGAIAPDTPYTYVFGPENRWVQNLSSRFHCSSRRALVPVLDFLEQCSQKDPAALAFSAGLICHIIADTIFHPLVEYYSGDMDRDEGAVTRHHLFETAMDYYFWKYSDDLNRVSVHRILKKTAVPYSWLIQYLTALFDITDDPRSRYIHPALLSHRLYQYLFRSRPVVSFFDSMHQKNRLIPARNHALMYPFKSPVTLPFFETDIYYRHPADGSEAVTTLAALAGQTANHALAVLDLVDEHLINGKKLSAVLHHPALPKISPGLAKDNFRYWTGNPDLESLLFNDLTLETELESVTIA